MPQIMFDSDADPMVKQICEMLRRYESEHPGAQTAVYRHGPAVLRIRILDPRFGKLSKSERWRLAWPYIETLPEEVQQEITILLLLTEAERAASHANVDFESPIPLGV